MDDKTHMDYEPLSHTEQAVITPCNGNPASNLNRTERNHARYGIQPGCTPLVQELADTMHAALARCAPHALSAAAKACVRGYLCEPALLTPLQKQGDPDNYLRRLLYAAPDRSFSILALIWLPAQYTPIHGHTAWGAAGVLEGNPYVDTFSVCETTPKVMGLRRNARLQLQPGDIATVEPGIDDVHRLGNDSATRCITLHIYGRDLLAHPGSINIDLNQLN
jgi:predicted metal-dependent enzyme (double-stranded beta helix superfamily)